MIRYRSTLTGSNSRSVWVAALVAASITGCSTNNDESANADPLASGDVSSKSNKDASVDETQSLLDDASVSDSKKREDAGQRAVDAAELRDSGTAPDVPVEAARVQRPPGARFAIDPSGRFAVYTLDSDENQVALGAPFTDRPDPRDEDLHRKIGTRFFEEFRDEFDFLFFEYHHITAYEKGADCYNIFGYSTSNTPLFPNSARLQSFIVNYATSVNVGSSPKSYLFGRGFEHELEHRWAQYWLDLPGVAYGSHYTTIGTWQSQVAFQIQLTKISATGQTSNGRAVFDGPLWDGEHYASGADGDLDRAPAYALGAVTDSECRQN